MFRESIGLFIPEQRAKLYIPKNSGLNEYVNNLLREVGVSDAGEFDRVDQSKGILEIISARGEDVPQRVDDCILRGDVAYGLTGDDLFDEYMLGAGNSPLGVLNTYDWFDPVVMPGVNRSFYTDMAHGAKYWTFVSEEVPRLAQSFFPLSTERAECFVAGLSMGGYGAFKLGLTYPNRFAAAASLSGALDMAQRLEEVEEERQSEFEDVFGDLSVLKGSEHDLFHLADKLVEYRTPPRLYQCCGTEDFLYAGNVCFREHAQKLGLDLTYEEGPGEHEWGYWDRQIQKVLAWLPLEGREK